MKALPERAAIKRPNTSLYPTKLSEMTKMHLHAEASTHESRNPIHVKPTTKINGVSNYRETGV